MTDRDPNCFHISASSVSAFKACPTRFRLGYREGIRKVEDTDAQRVGTSWGGIHEAYHDAYVAAEGTDEERAEFALYAATEYLNTRYAEIPMPVSKTIEEWDIERQIILTSFLAYLWYWQDDPIDPIASEVPFDLPLHAPRTGLPLPLDEVIRVGKIDHVVAWQGMVGNVERKSTSRSIAHDSDYWEKSQKDTQVSMYALAFRDMREAGLLPDEVLAHPDYNPDRFGNTLYDVWHKPTIQPKNLTQKDTAEFIESGTYFDQEFEVCVSAPESFEAGNGTVTVDGQVAEVTLGKKGFAIRETPAMYAARLLNDIYERPDFYFQRREIPRTDKDLRRFRVELFNIYNAQRLYDKHGVWFENEQQCRATFTCQYVPICYSEGADAVCDGETTPNGFTRIFTPLTVNESGE